MRRRNDRVLQCAVLVALACGIGDAAIAQDPASGSTVMEESASAIREVGAKYVAAFNKGDANAVASFWTPTAVYTNRQTGDSVTGREAIRAQFTDLFSKTPATQLTVNVQSIDLLSPNVAVEKGIASYQTGTNAPEVIPYSAVYIRVGDQWLLDRVTDDPQPVVRTHYEQLKSLEWMIGSWVDQGEGITIQTDCNWTKNQNFLVRTFSVTIEQEIELSGLQFIGWDAKEKQIRSWTFDSAGGHVEGRWTNRGDEWYVVKKGTSASGESISAVNVMTYVDEDTFRLKTVQRARDGKLLPNLKEVVVVRK